MDFTNSQIDIQQLPKMEEIEYLSLEEKYIKVLRINYLFLSGIPLIASVIWFFLSIESKIPSLISIGIFLLVIIITQLLVTKIYQYRGYALREKDVCQRGGIIFHRFSAIPFRRIQHLSVEQGPIARKFGLASVHIFTAAGDDNGMILNGITKERADDIKSFILNTIKSSIDD